MNINLLKKAIYIREFETMLLRLFNKGLLNGTVHTCVGQELAPVILCEYLIESDRIFSNHRGHGHFLAFNGDDRSLLAELMGKEDGVSKGIGGSQHLYNDRFISNGIQGGLAPSSVGFAYVNKLNCNNSITVCFIGDGTLGQGVLYESLNLASLFKTPTLFILENNQYAQSSSFKDTFRGDIRKRIEGFGLKYLSSNIWDFEHLNSVMKESVSYVRAGAPAFLEINCYRLNSHSKGDDNRVDEEVEEYSKKDLINLFKHENLDLYKQILDDTTNRLDFIFNECEKMLDLSRVDKFEFIFSEKCDKFYKNFEVASPSRVNKLIYNGLKEILNNPCSVMIGEDIMNLSPNTGKPYGGAFKVTNDLSDLFTNRVLNSPISEQAIIGFGIGAALNGYRSIVEIMFGDFMTLCLDQLLQQASKIPSMFGKKIDLPLIVRTPMGARRGYGPTHSQNIEKLFLFLPNITVVALNSIVNPEEIYYQLSNLNTTSIVIEDKVGYTKEFPAKFLNVFNIEYTSEKFPTAIITPDFIKPNVIIFTYGGILDELQIIMAELIENDIFPAIICPVSLSPLNVYPLIQMLESTKNIIFIEEGSKHGGLSSEVLSYLSENKIVYNLVCRISNESIIPCSKKAELSSVPNSRLILDKIIQDFNKP
jgi:2-oxoisovalerate dehydrogenase E1 component